MSDLIESALSDSYKPLRELTDEEIASATDTVLRSRTVKEHQDGAYILTVLGLSIPQQ